MESKGNVRVRVGNLQRSFYQSNCWVNTNANAGDKQSPLSDLEVWREQRGHE